MKPSLKALALLTLCSLLAGCETTRAIATIKPPADRLDCAPAGQRPSLPAEYVIDWSRVTTVPQARAEAEALVRSIRTREGITVGWIVQIEGKLWACSNDDQWLREFYAPLPTSEPR